MTKKNEYKFCQLAKVECKLMLQSKTNKWGHVGTTEDTVERPIPSLRHQKKSGRTSARTLP